jgi:hypothetical protein
MTRHLEGNGTTCVVTCHRPKLVLLVWQNAGYLVTPTVARVQRFGNYLFQWGAFCEIRRASGRSAVDNDMQSLDAFLVVEGRCDENAAADAGGDPSSAYTAMGLARESNDLG